MFFDFPFHCLPVTAFYRVMVGAQRAVLVILFCDLVVHRGVHGIVVLHAFIALVLVLFPLAIPATFLGWVDFPEHIPAGWGVGSFHNLRNEPQDCTNFGDDDL